MANNNDSRNVGVAKPSADGCMYVAPIGTPIPTNAIEPLDAAFKCVGYLSEDGFGENITRTSESKKAFGGDTVATSQNEYSETYTPTMIETNETSMKLAFGETNVTYDEKSGLHVVRNSKELEDHAVVFDLLVGADRVKRLAIERASVAEVGEVSNNGTDLLGYPITLSALPGTDGAYSHMWFASVGGDDEQEGGEPEAQAMDSSPIDDMTRDQLIAYATENAIDLNGASKKDDILAIIKAAESEVSE